MASTSDGRTAARGIPRWAQTKRGNHTAGNPGTSFETGNQDQIEPVTPKEDFRAEPLEARSAVRRTEYDADATRVLIISGMPTQIEQPFKASITEIGELKAAILPDNLPHVHFDKAYETESVVSNRGHLKITEDETAKDSKRRVFPDILCPELPLYEYGARVVQTNPVSVSNSDQPCATREGVNHCHITTWHEERAPECVNAKKEGGSRNRSEMKAAGAQTPKLIALLEQRVNILTAELDAFSYSISHDLRAPLRAIGFFAEILQEDYAAKLPPEARRKLGRIHANAMKMGELIDGLVTFSRFSRQPLTPRAIEPAGLVRRAFEDLKPEYEGRNVELKISCLPRCFADPALLQQVFINLISNAIKYSRHSKPAAIEVGSYQENGQCIYFVRDNGAGFDMEYAHKLFGVFQRLHSAEQFEGSGLGLAIAQRIVHRHEGRIWAESSPGAGSVFYFTLGGGLPYD